MAFLNEQGVKTLWTKIKDYTGNEIEANNEIINKSINDVDAKIPTGILTIKGGGDVVETFNGSANREVDIVAGENISIDTSDDGKIAISAVVTSVIVENAKHATTAEKDTSGNKIIEHYATKDELGNVDEKITGILVADDDTKVQKAASADTATNADNATTAAKVSNSLKIKLKNGTTEYNGSAAKEVDITPEAIGAQVVGNYATTAELSNTNTNITKIVNGETTVGKATSADTATTATSAGKLTTPVNIALTGDVSGSASFDGSKGISITTTVADDSHAHSDYATKEQHNNLVATVGSKAPLESPALTGTPTTPTPVDNAETNVKQIVNVEFVRNLFRTNDAMMFKGVINSNNELPATHDAGWTYKVGTKGTYAGKQCEVGDMIICITDGTAANNAHWTVIQNNIDGAVTSTTTSTTDGNIPVFSGTTGKIIKDSGTSLASLTTILGKKLEDVTIATDDNDSLVISKAGVISGDTPHLAVEADAANGVRTCNITLYTIPDSFFNSEFFN